MIQLFKEVTPSPNLSIISLEFIARASSVTHFNNCIVSPVYCFLSFLFCLTVFEFYMYECFVCIYVDVLLYLCFVPMEVRKRILDALDVEL